MSETKDQISAAISHAKADLERALGDLEKIPSFDPTSDYSKKASPSAVCRPATNRQPDTVWRWPRNWLTFWAVPSGVKASLDMAPAFHLAFQQPNEAGFMRLQP